MNYPTETKLLTLDYPVTVAGKDYKSLTFRRPRVRDNLIADKQNQADADKEVHLMALLAEVDRGVIEQLDMADYAAAQQIIVGFQKTSPKLAKETSNEAV
ncbi:MAG: hypothetical protein CENE_02672 [Candidatus Celerinatantimonas neptuna]|nr:MAG: hypothetical protein CENE_02672 [Candidatus Celerinatantimonas neptuna]